MSKKILIIKNITHEGPGLLDTTLERFAIDSHTVDLSCGGILPDPLHYDALVILGGPQSVNDKTESIQREIELASKAMEAGLPCLGICLGLQVLVKAGGGSVMANPLKETGFFDHEGEPYVVDLTESGKEDPLFRNMSDTFRVFQLHGETVEITDTMQLLAEGVHCRNQAIRIGKNAYGLQCHFELTPEMLTDWIRIDRDLQMMCEGDLTMQFNAIQKEYTNTGLSLINNFLRIAGIA
ncbi:type 1 glutamine amidotransferase [Chlorobium limicola]|uniref:Glutamine amidotransferase n=1 Tax=Chlorobium limicola TaxID=1092 RepID=A0A101JPM5_CHLLI|nr:type 1 glutamine amidotransferase [Chlorobium limicola]KUL30692.1 glutamine amidotransferase [Chlorobium limicola]